MNQILPLLKAIMFSLILVLSVTARLNAQTKGLIVKPALGAGRAVLDPNDDGYVSSPATPPGFKFNDVQESEIPYKALPLPAGEVLGDLLRGPTDGFSDFAFLFGNVDPVYTYLSNGNLMFRFRLGGIAPNSKGYSILIDTDNRFGNTGPNADPNYNAANPGFEVEIVLATGFGVRLYNVDGVPSPAVGSQLVNLPYDQYAQKAIAYTTNGGSADYFYDFYIPFSEITSRIPSFTANTPVRMVANTVMSAQHSALAGPISDVGGIDDRAYAGNYAAAFTNIIQNIVPTPLNVTPSSSFPPLRSATPVITGTYSAGTSTTASPIRITGTSTEAAGTLITVFNNGTSIGTTTVGSNGIWTYTLPNGSNLMAGDKLTATATASGKSVSLLSEQSTVYEPAFTCNRSATPTMTCASDKAMVGTVPAGVTSGTIRIYRFGDPTKPVDGIPAIPVRADGTWGWNCRDGIAATSCNAGQGCVSTTIGNGSYYAVLIEEGKCASPRSNEMCVGKGSIPTTATPVINTSNINVNTTSISGTAVAGSTVILLLDGINAGNTTATSAGAWTISGLNLRARQDVTVRALVNGSCVSNPASATVLGTASIAPVVNGPIRAGATSISGTSTEPAGTVITVMVNNSSICSTSCPVVDSFGNWTLSGISPALAANNTITATATAPGKSVSPLSNTITVSNSVTAPAIPVITGNYTEGATSVSGTGPNNSDINLYIDGFYLGTVRSTSTNWTVNGLSGSDIEKLLYAGGILTATSGTIGTNESAASNSMMVQCSSTIPDRTKPVTAAASAICQNSSAVIRIGSSEPGISYVLRNDANTADLSSAVMGTGGEISLTSYPLTASQRIRVNAMRGESPICGSVQLNNSADITVNPNPAAFTVTAQSSQVCTGSKAFVNVSNSQTNVSYQLRNKSDNSAVGTAVAGTGGQITLETPVLSTAGSFTYYVQATSGIAPTFCGTQMSNEVTITVNRAPANDLAVTAAASAICQNSSAVIRISNSEPGISYVLRNDANTADLSAAVTGTGNQISLTSYPLSASQKIRVLARNTGSSICNSALLNNSVDITVNPNPVAFTAAAQSNQVCVGSKAFINVSNSQTNVSYQLRNKSDNSAVGTAVAGTGGQITLETPALSMAGSYTYYVQATGVAPTNCGSQVSNDVTIMVNRTPANNLEVSAAASTICQNSSAVIRVRNSELGITYVLRNDANTANLSDAVAGTGGEISLTSYPLSASQRIRVNANSSSCGTVTLTNTADITVSPNPTAFSVTAQSNQICTGSKAFFIVNGSQSNVSYQLRNKSDNSAVGTAVTGTGGQITLETPVLSTAGSFTYYVQASGVAPTNCSTQSSNEITLTVNTTPSKNLDFIEGTSNPDGTINLLVKNSEMNVLYQLRLNGSDFRTPVTGNGGDIVLVSDVVTAEKKTYTVVARHGASGCSAQLEQQIELQSIAPLPVELVLFKATTQQNQIILNWATASETDNDRFEVERSQDGRTFTKIGTVKGKGTSSLTNNYTFKDTNPVTGTNYYRLRQVDFDGTFEFSKTVAAGIKAIAVTVKAYPNPFIDNVQVELATDEKGQVQVTLFDMQGRIVLRQQVTVEGRHTAFELQTQQMARGIYLLVVEGAGLNSTTKLMKQN